MMKSEVFARIFLFLLLVGAGGVGILAVGPAIGLGDGQVHELHARMPENGGWSLESITAEVGEPIRLRMTSDDVLHSFAIGQSDSAPVDLVPGKWEETPLVFDKPGRYTFYCTRWCGRNHWRMRGTILVTGGNTETVSQAEEPEKPLYLELDLNLDAPHLAENIPQSKPSPERGEAIESRLPAYALDRDTYLKYSPEAVWQRLRAEPTLTDLDDAAIWDAVAWIWQRQTSPEKLAKAAELYANNCAACHGETGKGDGVMVEGLPRFNPSQIHKEDHPTTEVTSQDGQMADSEMGLSAPRDFTDPHVLLGASPALLEGKIIRGGMGTGMPYWGPVFTGEEIDSLIAYLYQFALKTNGVAQ
jgi:mono/diheme cytochrome c family protein/plastocyanin